MQQLVITDHIKINQEYDLGDIHWCASYQDMVSHIYSPSNDTIIVLVIPRFPLIWSFELICKQDHDGSWGRAFFHFGLPEAGIFTATIVNAVNLMLVTLSLFIVWQEIVMGLQVNEVPGKFARRIHVISQIFKETAVPHSVCSVKFIAQEKWLAVGDGEGLLSHQAGRSCSQDGSPHLWGGRLEWCDWKTPWPTEGDHGPFSSAWGRYPGAGAGGEFRANLSPIRLPSSALSASTSARDFLAWLMLGEGLRGATRNLATFFGHVLQLAR